MGNGAAGGDNARRSTGLACVRLAAALSFDLETWYLLVTPAIDRRNRRHALIVSILTAGVLIFAGAVTGWGGLAVFGLVPGLVIYRTLRRKCRRRLAVMNRPFPANYEAILDSNVAFYRALIEPDKQRFRQLIQIFLDEVRVTGIRTEIDDTIRVLVAASAIIPIFGFHDWDYHRLGEVLVYPDLFNRKYQTDGDEDRNILGLTGLGHLSGVMILSKPALLEGYGNPSDKQNVGLHEFAHQMEQEEVSHGLPAEVPAEVVREWVAYVARELAAPDVNPAHINQYGYTNEHEFLAVLTEYFFESPAILQRRDPELYSLLSKLFHQDPASLLGSLRSQRHIGRNAACPCGSGKKFKDCCHPRRASIESSSGR